MNTSNTENDIGHQQNSAILKELSDIKASLAVNTNETQNIKLSISEIKTDVRDIKTNAVTQEQYKGLLEMLKDHEERLRVAETKLTRILTWGSAALLVLGILEFIINRFYHN